MDNNVSRQSSESCLSSIIPQERNFSTDSILFTSFGNKVRDKCIEMIYTALSTDSFIPGENILKKSMEIENNVWMNCDNQLSANYKSKLRSLQFNLKVKDNDVLRERLLCGDLKVNEFVLMTPEELASKEKRGEMEEAFKLNMNDAVTAGDTQGKIIILHFNQSILHYLFILYSINP